MMNLNGLSANILKKLQIIIEVVLEYAELVESRKNRVLIPRAIFKQKGLSIAETQQLIDKIARGENNLIKNIEHTRPIGPLPDLKTDFIKYDPVQAERDFQWGMKYYEEKYEENLEVEFGNKVSIKKLLNKVIEKQNWLTCDELKFNVKNGDAICGKIKASFLPNTHQFKILQALMELPNTNLDYETINKILCAERGRRDISFIMRDIKQKLGMTGKKRINKNKFKSRNGYQIVCKH